MTAYRGCPLNIGSLNTLLIFKLDTFEITVVSGFPFYKSVTRPNINFS